MQFLNIKLTLDGLNCILKHFGELPNSSGTYPLLVDLQAQGKAELDRIKTLPSDSQSTDTASSAKTS